MGPQPDILRRHGPLDKAPLTFCCSPGDNHDRQADRREPAAIDDTVRAFRARRLALELRRAVIGG